MTNKTLRLKPSEVLTAFSTAKANAVKHATSQIIELVNAEDHTTRISSTVPLHQPLFEPSPAQVWIEEYTPFEPVTIKLRFRNRDIVVRRLKIEPPLSPVFRVRPWDSGKDKVAKPERVDGKVAAGMEIAFALDFFPQEVTDYSLDLVCCTERERFVLPIRVRGLFAALDLPDELEFGTCPVKMPTSRVLTVRNVGTRGSSFAFLPSQHFGVSPPSVTLAQGSAVQIEVTLSPPNLESSEGELEIKDDSGQVCVVKLMGRVVNVDVFLSQPLVEPAATYMSLSSRKTVKICNESEFTLEFSWKSFVDFAHEEMERTHLLEELARMETAEYEALHLQLEEAEEDHAGLSESPFDVRKTLETKYRHLRKATLDDSMQFVDSCFSITPLSGRVWAHSEVDVIVCFTPEVANLYSCCAFLEIAGQATRLPLHLRGQGIGPKAKVVYNELLDFGDVFINDERTRDFTIQNKGEIPAEFELIPLTMPSGTSLLVHPSRGTLAVNTMLKVQVTFYSQELGDAFHHIRFGLQGSDEQLTVRFKAHVIPPVFHFDVDQVDFGIVSYSFPQMRTIKLINASKIAMKYSLRIPEEASYHQKELELLPTDGKLDAYGEQQITIHFTSHNVKVYQYQLVVGVTGVGTDLLSIPVRAQCCVPELTILRQELDFGRCFLRYSYKQMLVLENKSTHLCGRFEVAEQDDHSRAIATYEASESSGHIRPGQRTSVEISLVCEKLGSIRLPMIVNVPGSTDLPLSVTLSATGSGPKVEFDQSEINWGNCSCLVDHERILRMTNVSLIPAAYKMFIRGARSKFQIDRKEGVLLPGETLPLVVVANLDDTIVVKDQLHILITEGDNLVVPLSIRGTGTTMWSPSELQVIDFEHQMTSKECEWSCTLENKGKRTQVLTWINKTVVQANTKTGSGNQRGAAKKAAKVPSDSKSRVSNNRSGRNGTQDEVIPVFSVFPGTIELKPRTACVFVFKGLSSTAGLIEEELVCETRVGKEKVSRVAFVTAVRANFVNPKLIPSSTLLSFEYVHHPGNQITMQSQPLSFVNACELPLSFTLRTQTPFALDCWEASLLHPGKKLDLNVEFYPGFKDDLSCCLITSKVMISYPGHPQKDSVELFGDISFPNLSFETFHIDFGCALNDTQKSITMNVTNVSKVDTRFRWIFVEDEKETLSKKPHIPINQVFDISPIRGVLKPNESEKMEFVYYGHANRRFQSIVACEVEGGPEYEVTLTGEASSLVYKLDKQSLDFGQVFYNKTEDRDFSIMNVGKVPFSFSILIDGIARGRTVEVSPLNGKIAPNEKQKVLVRLRPGIPEWFSETIVLEIAHFEPIPFKVFGCGTFTAVTLNLPHENHAASVVRGEAPKWKELRKRARQNLDQKVLNAANLEAKALHDLSVSSADDFKLTLVCESGKNKSAKSVPESLQTKTVSQRVGAPGSPKRGVAIDELDIEFEACRILFADYLLVRELKKSDVKALKGIEPLCDDLVVNAEVPESLASAAPPGRLVSSIKTLKQSKAEVFPFVLAQFVLDFGNIVVGTHRIKRFSVTNIGHGPASFQLDKNLANLVDFQIEPERVVRLPEKESVDFSVTFHARKNVEMGVRMAQLSIKLKNGPPCIAMVRALVTMPDIAISTESLDFGRIGVGMCHVMFTQLHNVSVVPAEWAFKKPMGLTKDAKNFRVTPQSGLLAPGAKANIQIEFLPDDGRQYVLKVPISINFNSKTRSIMCRGEGSELRISFSPPLVELGPVLPCSPLEEHLVEIHNDSDYAVDVFSLDFDSCYQQDEALLRSLSAFASDDTLQLPIRVPGQPMSEYLAENGLMASIVEPMQEVANLDDFDTTEPPENDDVAALEQTSLVSQITIADFNLAPRKGLDYIVVGPPRCGKSTQARLLAEKESLTVWTINNAVELICTATGPLAAATRKALERNLSASCREDVPADSAALETPESSDIQQDGTPSQSIAHLLDQIVSWRLTQPDLITGGVLDGFYNSFLGFEETLKCCSKAFASARVIVLSFDDEAYDSMSSFLANHENKPESTSFLALSSSNDHVASNNSIENNDTDGTSNDNVQGSLHHQNHPIGSEESQHSISTRTTKIQALTSSTLDALNSQNTVSRAELDASSVADNVAHGVAMELPGMVPSKVFEPATFAEYVQALEAMKHQLALFIFEDTADPPQSSESARDTSYSSNNNADAVWANAREQATLDKFILDIPIVDVGPPLLVHGAIFSTLEKFVRELESRHQPLPASAKFQLVRRPPERCPRKRITRFSLRTLSSASEDGSEERLEVSDSRSQMISKDLRQTTERSAKEQSHKATGNSDQVSEATSVEPQPFTGRDSSSSSSCRWLIAPHSKASVLVQFSSADVGNFDCSLGFEIVGVRREFTLFARGICGVPTINSDPRNVFMHRVKSCPEGGFVQKKYVLSRNQFEFGPLIVTDQVAKAPETEQEVIEWQRTSPNNVEVFRMSNVSKFPIRLELGMAKQSGNMFSVFPPVLEIKEGDTKEVRVWANPSASGLHQNVLVCCIDDNPEPVEFQVTCYGCTPELKLRGPWEQPPAAAASGPNQGGHLPPALVDKSVVSHATASARTSGRASVFAQPNAPLAQQLRAPQSQPVLNFGRRLLTRQDEKTFYVENTSPVAVLWRLLHQDFPADFHILPVQGTIEPLQKVPILVAFSAMTEAVYELSLQIEYSDAESALQVADRNQTIGLTLCGEAFKIDVSSFDYGTPSQAPPALAANMPVSTVGGDGVLDFGLVRVGEEHSRSFSLQNRGKYSIKYVAVIPSAGIRKYFTIDPSEMVLEPRQSVMINVTFTSTSEVTLCDCKSIKCTIIEMLSGETHRQFYVYANARSVFSKFRLQPKSGIDFGSHKYNDRAYTKQIEIQNDGEFPFKFRAQAFTQTRARTMSDMLTIDTPLTLSKLQLGQFTISPDCGTLDPGTTMGLDVTFQPHDCAVYREMLEIEISDRNVNDAAETNLLLYELVGESCYPGIDTTDYENIFEEQTVVRSLAVEAAMPTAPTHRNGIFTASVQVVTFAEKEKVFSFGPFIASANWKGTMERFKISNPMKVTSTVRFSIKPGSSNSSETTKTDALKEELQAFTVQPTAWEIPPLEHRFVSVYFRPTSVALFHAMFRASVDDSPPQSRITDKLLEFELRGEGTMPSVTVIEPTVKDSTGALTLDYGRVRVSKTKEMRLTLRNDGILPATVLFSIQANPNFLFALDNGSIVVPPKVSKTVALHFRPQKAHDEPTSSQLGMTVQNNPLEKIIVKLWGIGFREDLVFDDLPHGYDDELHFDDVQVPKANVNDEGSKPEASFLSGTDQTLNDTKVFSLCNQSPDIVRFQWPSISPFHFSPNTGHLRPNTHKLIKAVFEPKLDGEKGVVYQDHRIALQTQRIKYTVDENDESGWDESMQTISYDDQAGLGSIAKQVVVEPTYEAIGPSSTIALSCFAAADAMAFECDTMSIAFRKTFMLQICTYKITLRNKSQIRLMYSCRWEQDARDQSNTSEGSLVAGGSDSDCPFEITPSNGTISREEAQVFTIKFAPMEVDEYSYSLYIDILDAQGNVAAAVKVDVRGGSLRPACHFDVENSDYAQRRAPHLVGPEGELGPLDPSIKVLEMESLGVRVRNTRRFYVVNPTNVSYEFSWTPHRDMNPCFRCATPKGLMLAGKRCEMIFEFTPQQLELQEMFWYFEIPHFQVSQLFLFVGTTTEPRVAMDRGSVNFNTLLVGARACQSIALVNQEHIPFNFVFDKVLADTAGDAPVLVVHPLKGVIPPNSRTPIEIKFTPAKEKSYSFNLNCIIKRKPTRLSLNVKGEGYGIHDALTVAADEQHENLTLALGSGNFLDFGVVPVNERVQRSVVIHNHGKFNFDFSWTMAKVSAAFAIEPMQGTVKKNDKIVCTLAFSPTKPTSLDGIQVTCTIAGFRNYVIALQGKARHNME